MTKTEELFRYNESRKYWRWKVHYEFYLDVYIITNFFFDYLTLLSIRELRNKQASIKRLFFAALFGVLCSTILMLKCKNAVWYPAVVHFLINPLMVYISFRQKRFREFLMDDIFCYILILLLGGMTQWVRKNTFIEEYFLALMAVISVMTTVVVLVCKGQKEEENIYDIKIQQGKTLISAKGFYDTGNRLMDPYLKLPVSLIGKDTLQRAEQESELAFRYIPFVSLGEEHGIVKAVTLDVLYIQKKKREVVVKPAVFAVVEDEFLKSKEYQVILNGRLW